eukprot:UN00083
MNDDETILCVESFGTLTNALQQQGEMDSEDEDDEYDVEEYETCHTQSCLFKLGDVVSIVNGNINCVVQRCPNEVVRVGTLDEKMCLITTKEKKGKITNKSYGVVGTEILF